MGLPNETGFTLAEEAMPPRCRTAWTTCCARRYAESRPELNDLRLEQSAAERFAKAEHALYLSESSGDRDRRASRPRRTRRCPAATAPSA